MMPTPRQTPRRRRPMLAPAQRWGARRIALDVLRRVEATDAYANILLDDRLRRGAPPPADRALATELVYGVLRWQGALDWRLASFLDRPLATLDPAVRLLLRLGTYQLT